MALRKKLRSVKGIKVWRTSAQSNDVAAYKRLDQLRSRRACHIWLECNGIHSIVECLLILMARENYLLELLCLYHQGASAYLKIAEWMKERKGFRALSWIPMGTKVIECTRLCRTMQSCSSSTKLLKWSGPGSPFVLLQWLQLNILWGSDTMAFPDSFAV